MNKTKKIDYASWPYVITMTFPWDGSKWDAHSKVGPYGVCYVVCVYGKMQGREYIVPSLDVFLDERLSEFVDVVRSGGSGGRSPSRSRRGSDTDPE